MIDLDQVGPRDLGEAHPERVDPERVRVLGVPGRDVPGHALGEAEPAEDPEGRGELTLAVRVFLLHRQPVRGHGEVELGIGHRADDDGCSHG